MNGVELTLEIGGRAMQTQRVDVEAGGSASIDLRAGHRRRARTCARRCALPNDALERDNVFNFVVSPEEPVRVIVAERPGAPRDGSLYLTRALAVGEAPRFES